MCFLTKRLSSHAHQGAVFFFLHAELGKAQKLFIIKLALFEYQNHIQKIPHQACFFIFIIWVCIHVFMSAILFLLSLLEKYVISTYFIVVVTQHSIVLTIKHVYSAQLWFNECLCLIILYAKGCFVLPHSSHLTCYLVLF